MSDNDNLVNIKTDIEIKANLEPVINSTPAGIKYIFNLLFGRKHAEAERMLKLTDAQNSIDIKKILTGDASYDFSSGQLIDRKNEIQNPKALIAEKIQDEEVSNLISCSIHAAPYIKNQENFDAPSELDEFVNRWKSEAKLISTETAQAIWGRVLAEEVNSPGSISLRTMDVIKNLSKDEATKFNKICKFVLFDYIVADNKDYSPITKEEFSSVRDAGLIINFTPGMYRGTDWPEIKLVKSNEISLDVFYVRCGHLFIFIEKEQPDSPQFKKPNFAYWELTKAGRELYKVIRDTIDIGVTDVAKSLFNANEDIASKLKYTTYTSVDKNQVDMNSIKNI